MWTGGQEHSSRGCIQTVPQLGPCSGAEFNTVQGSEFRFHNVTLESPTQRGHYINFASTFPLGPCNPIPWLLLHALSIPGSEISRVLLRKYTRTVKQSNSQTDVRIMGSCEEQRGPGGHVAMRTQGEPRERKHLAHILWELV